MNYLPNISVLLFACLLLVPQAQAASFRPLGFSGDGYGVSDDGGVVVGTDREGWTPTAFRWTPENGRELLGLLPGGVASSTARDVSADGRVIVGWSDSDSPDGDEAFRWTESTGMQKIGDLGGEQRGEANAVNANGSVIVGLSTSELGLEAFRWTAAGGMVGLGDIPDGRFGSSAEGVSADGNVVVGGGMGPSFSREAYRWTEAGGMVALGQLPGGNDRTWAWGVSPDGSAVVGGSTSADSGYGDQAFLWTAAGGMIGLGDLPGNTFWSRALDASTNGEVVVGFGDTDPNYWEAFVWTQADGMRRLIDVLLDNGATGLDGWIITTAEAISANGLWVVGNARPPGGSSERQPYLAYLGEGNPAPGPSFTDLHSVADINGNGSPDFAVVKFDEGKSAYGVHVMDGSTGEKIRRIGIGAEVPIATEIVTQNNGSPTIAVLRKLANDQYNVLVKNLETGGKVGNLYYGSAFHAVDLADAGDTDASGAPDIAVVGANDAQKVRIQLRDLDTGAFVTNIFQGNDAEPLQLEVLPNVNGVNGPEIAVLGVLHSNNRARVWVKEIATKVTVRRLTYGSVYAPGFMAFAPDAAGVGQHGIALLGTRSDTGRNRLQVRALGDGSLISNAYYNNKNLPVDIGTVSNTGVDGAADLAVLFEIPDGTGRVSLSESTSGVFLRNVPLSAISSPVALTISEDINGNGKPEVAGLGDADVTTKRVDVRDANSKASVTQIDVP